MRNTFVRTLVEIASSDDRVVLLTGDLGFSVVEPFADGFPDRYFNVGVAEQNMIGIATGLADAGFVPYAYSIAPFVTLRPYEFVRNGPVAHRLPVRIVGVGGGFEYGSAGPTHHALEDIAVMRALAGMTIVAPADARQAANAVHAVHNLAGPAYLRLGKDDRTVVPGLEGRFTLGRPELLRSGRDVCLVAMGAITSEAQAAAEVLAARDIDVGLLVVSTLGPDVEDALGEMVAGFATLVTVEAHSRIGGLGSLVSEVVAERGLGCRVVRCGVRSAHGEPGGSESYLNRRHGIDRDGIVASTVQVAAAPER